MPKYRSKMTGAIADTDARTYTMSGGAPVRLDPEVAASIPGPGWEPLDDGGGLYRTGRGDIADFSRNLYIKVEGDVDRYIGRTEEYAKSIGCEQLGGPTDGGPLYLSRDGALADYGRGLYAYSHGAGELQTPLEHVENSDYWTRIDLDEDAAVEFTSSLPGSYETACVRLTPIQDEDPVDNPAHYTRGGIEVMDVIEAYDLNFRTGNVLKYVLRHQYKGQPLTDLKKARKYLDREIEKLEAGS